VPDANPRCAVRAFRCFVRWSPCPSCDAAHACCDRGGLRSPGVPSETGRRVVSWGLSGWKGSHPVASSCACSQCDSPAPCPLRPASPWDPSVRWCTCGWPRPQDRTRDQRIARVGGTDPRLRPVVGLASPACDWADLRCNPSHNRSHLVYTWSLRRCKHDVLFACGKEFHLLRCAVYLLCIILMGPQRREGCGSGGGNN